MFTGRDFELNQLHHLMVTHTSSLSVVYGRRRVGKTRLIREFCKKHQKNIWQFDGLEGQPKKKQIQNFLDILSKYTHNNLYKKVDCDNWLDFFKILDEVVGKLQPQKKPVIFLDEFPYLDGGRTRIVSELKWAWDNLFSRQNNLHLVLCGSVASFMVDRVLRSTALYGRISLEICLAPLRLNDVSHFFGHKKNLEEVIDLYFLCGGIPAYLEQIDHNKTVSQNIADMAFCQNGYFVGEFDRIFKDTFKKDSIYRKIVSALAKNKSLKSSEILLELSLGKGSTFEAYLEHLMMAGFITAHVPWNRSISDSKLKRYAIWDEYLLFYLKFILPNMKHITRNKQAHLYHKIIQSQSYRSWRGLAFERLCIKHADLIMKSMAIEQLVTDYGPYFDRANNSKNGIQIDLMFVRHDPVITICEMKYLNRPIGKEIINDVERKIAILKEEKKTIEKVLITNQDITNDLRRSGYFDRVLSLRDVFTFA